MTGAGICAFLLAAAVWLWMDSSADADTEPDDQSTSMLHSAVQAYGHAKTHGPAPDRCLAAQRVALLYLLRNEQLHYRIWRDIQKTDCPAAALTS